MKVTLTKHGGFAGGIGWKPRVVDSSNLAESTARELMQLVDSIKDAPDAAQAPGRARDAMTYKIQIDDDSGESTVIRQSDVSMSPAFDSLLRWLEKAPD